MVGPDLVARQSEAHYVGKLEGRPTFKPLASAAAQFVAETSLAWISATCRFAAQPCAEATPCQITNRLVCFISVRQPTGHVDCHPTVLQSEAPRYKVPCDAATRTALPTFHHTPSHRCYCIPCRTIPTWSCHINYHVRVCVRAVDASLWQRQGVTEWIPLL